ncbi:MAG: transposase [Cyclobacteriaceae bacterium]
MSHKYKAKYPGELYFVTITVIDWVDLLTRPVYKDVIIDSLKHCQKAKGLNVHAYVIMSNHWHAILSSDSLTLEDIMRDMKKFVSKQLINLVKSSNESRKVWILKKFEFAADRVEKGVNYKVWKDGYHPVHLSSNEMIEQKLDYIHENPVKAGLVYEPEHYVYSSSRDYAGLSGLIALQMLD